MVFVESSSLCAKTKTLSRVVQHICIHVDVLRSRMVGLAIICILSLSIVHAGICCAYMYKKSASLVGFILFLKFGSEC